jgi:hypothetical protein
MTADVPSCPEGLPPSVDMSKPNAARIYDYLLGGSHNFAADRVAADALMAQSQGTTLPARINRSFLRRAVRFMLNQGIDQFLDLGSGIPTVGNVHQIAQAANPDARVVYVDNEPVAVAHSRQILAGDPNSGMVDADLRDTDAVLNHPDTLALLDFSRPVGVLLVAVFHFMRDTDDPDGVIAGYRAAVPADSYVGLSHFTADGLGERLRQGADEYSRSVTSLVSRSRADIAVLMTGLDVVEPGIVWTSQWRPDGGDPELTTPSDSIGYAAIGRVPS